ncbi:MAG: HEAT repeat domain-containing protein [Candidatus Zipacnadales bacterium]
MSRRLVIATVTLWGCAAYAWPQGDVNAVVDGLRSGDSVVRQAAMEKAAAIGAPMVEPLCDLMAEGTTFAQSVAEKTLYGVIAAVSQPGREAEKAALVEALGQRSKSISPDAVRVMATTLLGVLGGERAVSLLGNALVDPVTHEAARAGLERMPCPAATQVLLARWRQAPLDKQPACLLSLGMRQDPAALPMLLAYLGHNPDGFVSDPCYLAGIEALGMIGGTKAAVQLAELVTGANSTVRQCAVSGLITIADREQQCGGPLAHRCYRRAYDYAVTDAQRTAALLGLADTDPANRVKWLLKGAQSGHAWRSCEPLLIAEDATKVARWLAAQLNSASGEERARLEDLAQAVGYVR